MGMLVESGREYWRGVLGAGGFTAIPRWTRDPAIGVGEHREPIPGDLADALRRLADSSALPLSSLLLAAHAKVLAALSGEREVATGYVPAAGDRPLPCRLSTERRTWRELLEHAQRAESQLLAHRDFPVDALAGELGLTGPLFETVLDPSGDGGELAGHTVAVGGHRPAGGPARAAAALPDRRARRRGRRPDRRLPPHRARADGRRPGCRAQPAEPAVGARAHLPARRAGRAAAGAARPPVPRAVRAAGAPRTPTPSRPCTPAGSGPTGSSTPAPTGWAEPCWPAGCAARAWSRW